MVMLAMMFLTGSFCSLGEESAQAVQAAPSEFIHITSVRIENGSRLVIKGQQEGSWSDPAVYDNYLYLFEMKPYERSLEGRSDYCGWVTKGDEIAFELPLNYGTAQDRLYSSFVVAVYDGSKYTIVSNEMYVNNPETLAKYTEAYQDGLTKKGLLIQNTEFGLDDAFDLGVKHVIVNIPFNHILGTGIDYSYDGKTYHFSSDVVAVYDDTIRRMSEKGLIVTAVLLNGWNANTPELFYPGLTQQPGDVATYYGFHVSTQEGYDTLRAVAAFLADRYGTISSTYGKVSNWVVGNEINNQLWNYMGPMSLEQYMDEFERAFRVFYTAIKSTSSNSRVYFSTDFNWVNDADGQLKYNAKDVIDTFNNLIIPGGNIDWNLAYHPYSMPMTEPEFWNDEETGLISSEVTSPIINMINLNVLTDYLSQSRFWNTKGQVRSVILSEQGFTSVSATRGKVEDLQAAAIAYAYYIADSNPHVDAFIMSRQVDAPVEVNTSCSFGLYSCDLNQPNDIVPTMPKPSWYVYKNIDNRRTTLETTEKYKALIGIEKWSDVIPDFRWRNLEN